MNVWVYLMYIFNIVCHHHVGSFIYWVYVTSLKCNANGQSTYTYHSWIEIVYTTGCSYCLTFGISIILWYHVCYPFQKWSCIQVGPTFCPFLEYFAISSHFWFEDLSFCASNLKVSFSFLFHCQHMNENFLYKRDKRAVTVVHMTSYLKNLG